jgi:hypothetical protein
MNNLKKISLASVLALSSMASNAELVSGDWKALNDGLTTIDMSTGIEWMDLSETSHMSFNEVEELFSSEFNGWRFPTQNEVSQLLSGAFINKDAYFQSSNTEAFRDNAVVTSEGYNFTQLFGITSSDTSQVQSRGMLLDEGNKSWSSIVYSGVSFRESDGYTTLYSNAPATSDYNYKSFHLSIYLVNDGGVTLSSINDPSLNSNNPNAPEVSVSVPLPATLGLLGLVMAGLSFRRKSA